MNEPQNAILSERSQSQKATYCMIIFLWNVWNREVQTESRLVITRDQWMRIGVDCLLTGVRLFFSRWWKCSELVIANIVNTVQSLNSALKWQIFYLLVYEHISIKILKSCNFKKLIWILESELHLPSPVDDPRLQPLVTCLPPTTYWAFWRHVFPLSYFQHPAQGLWHGRLSKLGG